MDAVGWWVVHFNGDSGDMEDKLCSERSCTAVTPVSEEHLNQLIRANWWIMDRELWRLILA